MSSEPGAVAGNGAVVYTYDMVGNRTAMTDTRTGKTVATTYSYDANNRLKETEKTLPDKSVVTERYGYDRNGNQTSMLRETLQPTDSLPATAKVSFGGAYELSEYDAFGRLTAVKTDTVEAQYAYNPNGLRHSKTVNGAKTVHVWDGSRMAAEVPAGGSVAWYVRGATLLWSNTASGRATYLHNAHGDVVALSGAGGLREYSYDAFGNQLEQGVPIAWELVTTDTDANPFRYCGEYSDAETGNVYLRARYYDPGTGRFISEDPIRDGSNWYAYCVNNPIAFVDPSGNEPISVAVATAEALVAAALLAIAIYLVTPAGQRAMRDFQQSVGMAISDFSTTATDWAVQAEDAKTYFYQVSGGLRDATISLVRDVVTSQREKIEPNGQTVYVHYDTTTYQIYYVGRTGNYERRYMEHSRWNSAHPILGDSGRDMMPVATGLTYYQAKVMEQLLISGFSLQALDNARNEIAAGNWDKAWAEINRITELTSSNVATPSNVVEHLFRELFG